MFRNPSKSLSERELIGFARFFVRRISLDVEIFLASDTFRHGEEQKTKKKEDK